MKARTWVLIACLSFVAISIVGASALTSRNQATQRHRKSKDTRTPVTSMPEVLSKVKNLEVTRAWIVDPGTPTVGVELEIKNKSNKDVLAFDVVCGDGAITRNGLTDEEHPVVVLPAHGTTTLRMTFSEMTFGAPLVVSSVTYADKTEEGDAESLDAMHQGRDHDREVMKARKQQKG